MAAKYLISFLFFLYPYIVNYGAEPPQVMIVQPLNGSVFDGEQIKVDYIISGTEVKYAKVFVDDRATQLLTEVKTGQNTVIVDVPARDCKISIVAQNESGESAPAVVRLKRSEYVFKPTLYILAVGVSKYANPELRLQFAAKDAIDFSQSMLKQHGLLYEKVELKLLTDELANSENIHDGLNWLVRETTQRDVAMLFMAGHGINNNVGEFFFMPVNADVERLNATCVGYREIKSAIDANAGKLLVFMDACHSGNMMGNTQRAAMLATAIAELTGADNGAMVFTSSTGRQFSLENPEWNNGAFTKALVEGLNGEADLYGRKTVTVKSLDLYITNRVKELTDGQQAPTTVIPTSVPDFPIAVVAENYVSPRTQTLQEARQNDEKLWAATKKTNTIEAYELYQAEGIQAEYRQAAKKWLCDAYFRQAVTLSQKTKKAELLKQSNAYFSMAKECNLDNREIDFYVEKNDRLIMESIQKKNSDFVFFGYAADVQSLAGLSFGKNKQQSFGWYFTARLSPKTVIPYFIENLNEDLYTINKSGQITDSSGDIKPDAGLTDESYKINFNAALGMTRKIYYPLWCYLGAGVSWDSFIRSYTAENDATYWVQYADRTKFNPMLDLGLSLKLGKIVCSSGIRINTSFKNCYYTFGLQFVSKYR